MTTLELMSVIEMFLFAVSQWENHVYEVYVMQLTLTI